MKTILLIFSIIFLTAANILSQPHQWWTSSYSTPAAGSMDTARGLVLDGDRNVYVGGWGNGFGTGSDIILIKLNPNTGDTIWTKRYTGPGANEDKALALTSDNNFIYLTGFSFQPTRDIITIKYDKFGNIVWLRTYNGSNNGGDYGWAIHVDAQGNVYVTGRSDVGKFLQHYTTIKYNSVGTVQWAQVYDGPLSRSFDEAHCISADNFGNVYVSGISTILQDFHTADFMTMKYDINGNLQWAKRYNGTGNDEDNVAAMVVRGGSVYVTGRTDSANGNYNYCTIKYDAADGSTLADAFYTGPALRQADIPMDMRADLDGNIYVTGHSMGFSNTFDYATIKYDANLQQQWTSRYEGSGNDVAAKFVLGNSGIYVTGTSTPIAGNADFLTVKYNYSGSQVWSTRFNGRSSGGDFSSGIAVDQVDNIFITGFGKSSISEDDIYTVRYSNNPIGIQSVSTNIPSKYELYQNYPNPFNPATNIVFDIPTASVSNTRLIVYDILGREVEMVINQQLSPGKYLVNWNASQHSSGIYFYKLTSGDFVKTNKMILVE